MNAFERAETKVQLLSREFLPAWTALRSAIDDLIGSYNRTEKGKLYPAGRRLQEGDRAVIVSCDKGLSNDRFHHVMLIITVSFREGEYEIVVVTERWLSVNGREVMQESTSTETFRFDGDVAAQTVWLTSGGDRLSAFQCAEAFLVSALR
jgi:hypothetical protein